MDNHYLVNGSWRIKKITYLLWLPTVCKLHKQKICFGLIEFANSDWSVNLSQQCHGLFMAILPRCIDGLTDLPNAPPHALIDWETGCVLSNGKQNRSLWACHRLLAPIREEWRPHPQACLRGIFPLPDRDNNVSKCVFWISSFINVRHNSV